MKHLLGIIGSPRRGGNTHILVSRVVEAAAACGVAAVRPAGGESGGAAVSGVSPGRAAGKEAAGENAAGSLSAADTANAGSSVVDGMTRENTAAPGNVRGRGTDTADLVFLADLRIEECDGCHVCWKGKPCIKKDDMNGLYRRIIEADVLVLGTPVYWYGPTAAMKAFIDRFVYFNCPQNRKKIRDKRVAVVIPFEEEKMDTGEFVASFFTRCFSYLEMKQVGALIAPGVGERGAVLKKPEILEAAARLGRRLEKGIE
jgi:multimeric flavodoxin WrbA